MKRLAFVLLATATAAGLLAACSGDDKPTTPMCTWPSPYKKPATPANVLFNLQMAFEERDAAWFDSLLYDAEANGDAADAFLFNSPGSRYEGYSTRAGFAAWADAFFASSAVEAISTEMDCGAAGPVLDPIWSGVMQAPVDSMTLGVAVRDPLSGDLTSVQTTSTDGRFYFKVQWVDACGDPMWRIVRWEHRGGWLVRLPVQKMPTSPENVLSNLEQACRYRKAAWYDSLFCSEAAGGYTFRFWDEDVMDHRVPDSTWDRSAEVASTTAMFADPQVEEIEAGLICSAPMYSISPGEEGQKIILVTSASLQVVTRPEGSTEPLILKVDSNLARFRFKVQSVDAEGDSMWRVVHWEDLGPVFGAKSAGQRTTWGTVKSLWYP